MNKQLNITESEILKAIEDSRNPNNSPQALTIEDISIKSGLSAKTVRKWIKEMKMKGIEFQTIQVIRYSIWDKPYRTMGIVGIIWDKENKEPYYKDNSIKAEWMP